MMGSVRSLLVVGVLLTLAISEEDADYSENSDEDALVARTADRSHLLVCVWALDVQRALII